MVYFLVVLKNRIFYIWVVLQSLLLCCGEEIAHAQIRGLEGHSETTMLEFDVGRRQPCFQRQLFSELEHHMLIYQNNVHDAQLLK